MQSTHIFGAAISLALLGAACSSDPATGTSGGVDAAVTAACDKLFEARVAREATCGGVQLDDAAKGAAKTRARAACTSGATAPGTSATAATIDACASAVAAASCDPRDERPLCEPAPGKLGDGTACFDEGQCTSGFCRHAPAGATLARCGVCSPLIAIGASCTATDRCVKDAACLNGACVRITKVAAGGACVGQANLECEDGLVCAESGKCAARVAAGGACKSSPECDLDLICASSKCASKRAEGESCKGDEECGAGLVCAPKTGKCTKPKLAAPGEKCDGVLTQCTTGGCSAATNGVCPTVQAEGGPCDPADRKNTCDRFLRCVEGKCIVDDPASCK